MQRSDLRECTPFIRAYLVPGAELKCAPMCLHPRVQEPVAKPEMSVMLAS